MTESLSDDMDEILDVEKTELREQRVLSTLLEKQRTKSGHHFVIQVRMGEIASYVTSVNLRWVAEHVQFAGDLPIFHNTSVASKRVAIDQETIDQIQQRQPDWRRQLQMATYLATRKHHKFPPLLLVAYQGWVYNEGDERWGTDKRAMQESLTLSGLEPSGTYWDLDYGETNFYALDGQHRLMAILGLRDLITEGFLHALDENRNPKKHAGLSREEIVEHIHTETGEDRGRVHARLQHLMDERIGIEIVPAVVMGESYGDALLRLRQMFVDVNENAKPLTASQIVQLDESNGFRVVARRIMVAHDLLRSTPNAEGEDRPKVDPTRTTLPEGSSCFTTLKTLVDIVRCYLTENKRLKDSESFASWSQFVAKGIYVRPEDALLESGSHSMMDYISALARIPSHLAFIQGKSASEIRSDGGDDSILFRPVVQTALAEAIGKLVTSGSSLDSIVEELARQESLGQLRLRDKKTPWFGVLCDPVSLNMRRYQKNERLCSRMFQYLLGGGIEDDTDREELRSDFAAERRIDENSAINIDGEKVSLEDVRLPNPWR